MSGSLTDGMDALSQLPSFTFFTQGNSQLQLLNLMVMAMVLMLTCVNAGAVKVVEGGHSLKLAMYLGITMCLAGAAMLFVPSLVQGVFSGISMVNK
jgi:archaellum biogenesis protein FlaJ (TadC family)